MVSLSCRLEKPSKHNIAQLCSTFLFTVYRSVREGCLESRINAQCTEYLHLPSFHYNACFLLGSDEQEPGSAGAIATTAASPVYSNPTTRIRNTHHTPALVAHCYQ